MEMDTPMDDSTKKFLLKVIEMLGKGFKDKENHNYTSDIEVSRLAYNVLRNDVEYITVKALLNLPALVDTNCVFITMREVLEFHLPVLQNLISSYVCKMECLKAIEESCLEYDHLKENEITAFIIHFLHQASILDGESVLEFFELLEEKESPLVDQNSFKVLIGWLQDEANKKRAEARNDLDWSEDEDDKPLSHWLKRGIERSLNVKPVYVWVAKPLVPPSQYNPLFVWVNKNGEEMGIEKPVQDDDGFGEDETSQEGQNEEDEQYEEDERSEADEQLEDDEESENGVKDFNELSLDDLPLKYLFDNLTMNNMKDKDRH